MVIKVDKIVEAIQEGTDTANDKFQNWSNGLSIVDHGVESLMVACIAEAVNGNQEAQESLRMEVPFWQIQQASGAGLKPGPNPAAVGDRYRMDIVLFNKKVRPTCVIEVKRSWDRTRCYRDLERIRDLIHTCGPARKGSLRRGFLATMLVGWDSETGCADVQIRESMELEREELIRNFNKKEKNVRYYLGEVKPIEEIFATRDLRMASSFCIEIFSKNSPNRN